MELIYKTDKKVTSIVHCLAKFINTHTGIGTTTMINACIIVFFASSLASDYIHQPSGAWFPVLFTALSLVMVVIFYQWLGDYEQGVIPEKRIIITRTASVLRLLLLAGISILLFRMLRYYLIGTEIEAYLYLNAISLLSFALALYLLNTDKINPAKRSKKKALWGRLQL